VDTIVAHTHPFVIGVDTHARTHTYAVLTAAGQHLGTETFPNTAAGRSRAIAWAGRRASGVADVLWVVEGAGSYGAQLIGASDSGCRSCETTPKQRFSTEATYSGLLRSSRTSCAVR